MNVQTWELLWGGDLGTDPKLPFLTGSTCSRPRPNEHAGGPYGDVIPSIESGVASSRLEEPGWP